MELWKVSKELMKTLVLQDQVTTSSLFFSKIANFNLITCSFDVLNYKQIRS